MTPIVNRSNGRDPVTGHFLRGNAGGPGSPVVKRAKELRQRLDDALYDVVQPERLKAALEAILKSAEKGDVAACKLLLERLEGNSLARSLEQLELVVAARLTGVADG